MATALDSPYFPQLWNVQAFGPWHPSYTSYPLFLLDMKTLSQKSSNLALTKPFSGKAVIIMSILCMEPISPETSTLWPQCVLGRGVLWFLLGCSAQCTAMPGSPAVGPCDLMREGLTTWMMAHEMRLGSYFQRGAMVVAGVCT